MSIIESYQDPRTREELARVHYYLRPDGRVGGSGLKDPKMLLEDGTIYVLDL